MTEKRRLAQKREDGCVRRYCDYCDWEWDRPVLVKVLEVLKDV